MRKIAIERQIGLFLFLGLLMGTSLSAGGQSFITNGLVAYYPFNGSANDAVNGNDGSPFNVTFTTNRFGVANGAIQLNGHSSYVEIAYSTNFDFPTNGTFSLSAWFATDGYSSPAGIGSLIVKSPSNGAWDYGLEAGYNYTGFNQTNVLWAGLAAEYPCVATNLLQIGIWYQGTITYSNRSWALYQNGVLVAQTNTSYTITRSTSGIAIGQKGQGATDFFNGAISDVRIYDRALSSNEVQELYLYESHLPLSIYTAVELNFFALSGQTYQIQSSSNLNSWVNVGSPITGSNQTIQQYFSTHGTNVQFYRANDVTP